MILHKLDKTVLKALGTKRLSAAELARQAVLGRTTVLYRLQKLTKDGFVTRLSLNKRKILYSVNKKAVNEARDSRAFEVFTGKQVIQGYKYFIQLPKQSFIYGIQGLGAVEKIFRVLPDEFIIDAHKAYKRKNIVLFGLANKRTLSIFSGLKDSMVQSHFGRAVGVKLVEGDIFLGSCEILSSQSVFLISNVAQKRIIVIKDKEMAKFFYEILSFLYNVSDNIEVFSLNQYLNNLLKQKQVIPNDK